MKLVTESFHYVSSKFQQFKTENSVSVLCWKCSMWM